AMSEVDGVEWAAAAMGTPANVETLAAQGFDLDGVDASANDCFMAVRATSDEAGDAALDVGEAAVSGGGGLTAPAGGAAGGAQEVMDLLDRGGARVTAVIGVGCRDLSQTVGGRMARSGLRALGADAGTDAVLLVSKPLSDEVARVVLAEAGPKPAVAALIGLA